jgi:rhodanese-related sulfurtransferase
LHIASPEIRPWWRLIFGAEGASLAAAAGLVRRRARRAWVSDRNFRVEDLTPQQVAEGVAEGRYLLLDIREPNEVAAEAYPDAVVMPLSSFDPAEIPDLNGRELVFACRSGNRSAKISLALQAAGFPYDKHLAGGIIAWKAAGLPIRIGG